MQQQHGFAEVNGTRLYYEVAGSGHPLVLIHGFSPDTRMWDDQFETFAEHYQVIRCDARGFGKSALPTDESDAWSDDLKPLLEHLGIAHAYILGHSMGGWTATYYAQAYPKATDAMMLVDPALPVVQRSQESAEFFRLVYDTAKESGIEAAKEIWRNSPVSEPAREKPDVAARLEEMLSDYSGWHWLNTDRPVGDLDSSLVQGLGEISAPTLIIVGDRSLPDMHAIADTLQQHIPKAQKVVLPGVGHYSMMEDPNRFNETVLSFLAGI